MDGDSQSRNHRRPGRGSAGSIGEREERLDDLLDSIINQSMERVSRKQSNQQETAPMQEESGPAREEPKESEEDPQELSEAADAVTQRTDTDRSRASEEVSAAVATALEADEEKEEPSVDVFEEAREAEMAKSKTNEAMELEAAILSQIQEDHARDLEDEDEYDEEEEEYEPSFDKRHSEVVPARDDVSVVPQNEEDRRVTKKDVFSLVLYVALVFALTFLIVHFVGQRTRVSGSSMEDTLSDGDNLIVDKLSYRFSDPERFDVIIFPPRGEEETYYIKRIIGLPGETIQIDDEGNIYVDGEVLEENYGLDEIADPGTAREPVTLGKDEFFVLGDNRNNSTDSRWPTVGAVERKDIIGRAWVRIYPFNKMKCLTTKDSQ